MKIGLQLSEVTAYGIPGHRSNVRYSRTSGTSVTRYPLRPLIRPLSRWSVWRWREGEREGSAPSSPPLRAPIAGHRFGDCFSRQTLR